jgi:hypothetical protein
MLTLMNFLWVHTRTIPLKSSNCKKKSYFDENFGFTCVDKEFVDGKIQDVDMRFLSKYEWPGESVRLLPGAPDSFCGCP